MLDRPDITVTIRLPSDLSKLLDQSAKDYDLTRGELIRRALADYLSTPQETEAFARPKMARPVLS